MHVRVAVTCACVATFTAAHAEQVPLACEKVRSQLETILAQQPPGTVATLLEPLSACLAAHRICGVVYDHTQAHAHVFSGEQSTDVPGLEYSKDGATYALMAARSLPPSRKSGLEYCLALTPNEQKSAGPFDWYGWQIARGGEVRQLDLSAESTDSVRTNPRSMAVAIWNLYEAKY
jgi:hypothetical protein